LTGKLRGSQNPGRGLSWTRCALDFIQRRRVFQGGSVAELSPTHAARATRRITFAFRVFGMSPTNKTSLGANALLRLDGERVF